MALRDLTRAAVEAAMRDFERLERDGTVERLRYKDARSYFVVAEYGRRLPSKAVAGIAHGYIGPGFDMLSSTEFSGGEATVAAAFRSLGFEVIHEAAARNPTWVRDELILALDLYLRHRRSTPGKGSDAVKELSNVLNRLAAKLGLTGDVDFRNAAGVYMKLMNFRSLDPEYTSQGQKGLQRGGRGDQEVWNEFAADPARLAGVAAAIRAAIDSPIDLPIDPYDDEEEGSAEGRILYRRHKSRERDGGLPKKLKDQMLRHTGKLECEACGFDFHTRYGEHGYGFMEAHHRLPLHQSMEDRKTRLQDLALVCANCHRMIHRNGHHLGLEELRALLPER